MDLQQAEKQGEALGELCLQKTEREVQLDFAEKAAELIMFKLMSVKESSCEDLTDYVMSCGIKPHDQRAFGPVFMKLARSGVIEQAGWTPRRKGHGAPGGRVWKIGGVQP